MFLKLGAQRGILCLPAGLQLSEEQGVSQRNPQNSPEKYMNTWRCWLIWEWGLSLLKDCSTLFVPVPLSTTPQPQLLKKEKLYP